MKLKLSLILSGGGARGAYHLGVLDALDRAGVEIMSISGASIGSIVGAGYFSKIPPREMLEVFCSKKFKKAIKIKFKNGIFHFDLNAPIIHELVKGCENLEDLPKPLFVSVTNLDKGEVEYKNSGNIREILAASSSILPLFAPIKIGDYFYADGGFSDNFPYLPLKDSAYPILGINLHPIIKPNKYSFFSNLKLAIFLAWQSGTKKSIEKCDFYLAPKEITNFPILRISRLEELFEMGVKNGEKIIKDLSVYYKG